MIISLFIEDKRRRKIWICTEAKIGITLVALVISIIVLLILATVSISLVINNGILDKAKYAVNKYSEGEIIEQIKLAYLECETYKLSNSNVNEEEFLTNILKQKLNDNGLTVKVKKGKVTVKTTVKGEPKTYRYDINKGEVKEYQYVDPFNYGGKEKNDLVPGDDISIGTEKFRVFYNQDGIIKAMPWYNIELKLENPKQMRRSQSAVFSSEVYWSSLVDEINMSDSRNNIQQYILAYQRTIEELGAEEIQVRIAKYSEVENFLNNAEILNPGDDLYYWIGSSDKNANNVKIVRGDGWLMSIQYDYPSFVRPIIIIEY